MKVPRAAEWHLQSDTPFVAAAGNYRNPAPGVASIQVSFVSPENVAVTIGSATVKAPGPPGSIETGPEEQRGFKLQATAPAAAAVRFEVRLEVVAPGSPSLQRKADHHGHDDRRRHPVH